ncbi:MAG TPA: orotidine 5'-phosphate decarboxylase / HUMPS family protein [Anaerolineales bacterium]|nr:orotidine 5'-phosphate decarboxylase / HUMPS family protein [Anaerolineales bacterium]
MPKIQLAIDTLDWERAIELASLAAPYVDILEAGTPLIKSVGIRIVTALKDAHPEKLVLADLKSSDVGAYEAGMAFRAGADVVTTQGITTLATIAEVQREADTWKRRAEVDMTGVKDPVSRSRELQKVGVSLVLYHRSIDEELTTGALWDGAACQAMQAMCDLGLDVAVAGGLNIELLPVLCPAPIYAIVVGRGITAEPDPAATAKALSERVRELWPA